ncbi:metallophosphoesterase [uncultured Bacteroides sp.]|uniref:metallophosphoesterase family protein n=1 Tax=uncultured Bacteroides sp. TaxID=162156 RepID=UPI00263A20A6|nr:metallophosphoesterase [uncultured Bacteroides sp.]
MIRCYLIVLCIISGLLTGCDMIDYHPYDVRIKGERNINAHNIEAIETMCQDKDTLRFVAMSDSQRWYDETEDFVEALNRRNDIDFVIHGGDLSDFGVTDEFLWQRDIMNGLKVPYVALIGNHDCLGTGREAFRAIFGETDFSFIANRIKFVCLNTNALEYDYSDPIPDFDFMGNEISARKDEYDRTVVCMHARPYSDVFNNNVAKVFQTYVKSFPGLLFCTVAHEHHVAEMDLFNDGVMYYMTGCMKYRNYTLYTITADGYEREVVYF